MKKHKMGTNELFGDLGSEDTFQARDCSDWASPPL